MLLGGEAKSFAFAQPESTLYTLYWYMVVVVGYYKILQ